MRPTASLVLLSGLAFLGLSANGADAACTLPYQLTNGQVADATQVMANFNALVNCISAAPAGGTNAVQYNAGGGNLGGVGPLTNGQVVVGSTGNPPQAANLTAGSGIAITNGAGSVSIAATGAAFQREFGPYAPPNASLFTFIDSAGGTAPTLTNVTDVGLVYSIPIAASSNYPGAYTAVPGTVPWTLTVRAKYAALTGSFPEFGIWIKDTSGKMMGLVNETRSNVPNIILKKNNSNSSLNTNAYLKAFYQVPEWFRVSYDGVNITWSASWDSQNWLVVWSESSTAFLNGNLQYVGLGGVNYITDTAAWRSGSNMGAVITYWNLQ